MSALEKRSALKTANASGIGKKDLVRRAICSRIISGVYREGEKVPSCREISGQLHVSKNSAYEAYLDLVEIGILESHNRSGFTWGQQCQRYIPMMTSVGMQALQSSHSL